LFTLTASMGENEPTRSSRASAMSTARAATRLFVTSASHWPGAVFGSPLATSDVPPAVVNSTSTLSALAVGAARHRIRIGAVNVNPRFFNMAAIMLEPLWGVNRLGQLAFKGPWVAEGVLIEGENSEPVMSTLVPFTRTLPAAPPPPPKL